MGIIMSLFVIVAFLVMLPYIVHLAAGMVVVFFVVALAAMMTK